VSTVLVVLKNRDKRHNLGIHYTAYRSIQTVKKRRLCEKAVLINDPSFQSATRTNFLLEGSV
jgi:hypothetical protein